MRAAEFIQVEQPPDQKEETHVLAGGVGFEGQTKQTSGCNAATSAHALQPADAQRKLFANYQAHGAMQGFVVDCIEADDGADEYVVSKWAYTQRYRSLSELAAALKRMGVKV